MNEKHQKEDTQKEDMQKKDDTALEECLEQIDAIIEEMESGELSLDRSFELYQEGLSRIKLANERLDAVEKAMLVLNEDGELEEFA